MAPRAPAPTLVWMLPEQADLLRAVGARAGLEIIEAGIPAWAARARSADLARPFPGAQAFSDLRQAIASTTARVALLATAPDAEATLTDDPHAAAEEAELARQCRARGVSLLSMEPIPGAAADGRATDGAPAAPGEARFLPLMRESRAFRAAADVLAAFGLPRTLSVSFRCGGHHGTLGARLFDAMHLLHGLMGEPESIDASIVTHVAPTGVRRAPGESLRALRGDLTANVRFAGARAASLCLSDRAGRWFRGIAIIGEPGCIRLDESGFERIDDAGQTIDSTTLRPRRDKSAGPEVDAGAVAALGEQVAAAIDPHAPRPAPFDQPSVMAMCDAAILSARTGQPESPATLLRMSGSA